MASPQQSRPKARRTLPDVGFDVPLWLQEFCTETKTRLENIGQTPDAPAQPTGVTLTEQFPGILVSWNRTLNTARYIVYRNSTGVFSTARIVGIQPHIDATSLLDITPTVSGSTQYYWVVAENTAGVQGPLSAMTTTTLPIFTTTIDVQQFLSSGTWTLPSSWLTGMANVTLVGGGGGGGNGATIVGGGGGGSGGGSGCTIVDTLLLTSNQTVTVGGGGAAITAGTASTFGSLLTAAGGAAGGSASAINGGSAATFVRAITAGSAFITALNSMAGLRGGDGGSTTGGITPHDGMAGDPYPGKFIGGTGGANDAVSNGGGGGGAGYKGTGGAGGAAGGGAGTAAAANTGAGGGGGGGITVGSAGTGGAGGSGFCIVYAWRAS